jgi:hypothetical protein
MASAISGDDDHHLIDARRQNALETQVVAHGLGAQHDLRAANQRYERPAHRIAAAFRKNLGGLFLRLGELICRDGRHPVLSPEREAEQAECRERRD